MVKIYVVYNFGQYNHLIHRVLRDIGVESKLIQNTTPINELDVDGLIIGGGPSLDKTGNCREYITSLNIPILGICLGHQLIAEVFGGEVGRGKTGGYAEVEVEIVDEDDLFKDIPKKIKVWSSHMDEVKRLPENFSILARSNVCDIEAMKHKKKPIYGIQWHPEVYHSEYGVEVYKNFVEVCRR